MIRKVRLSVVGALVVAFLIGGILGVLAQRAHLPGKVLRQVGIIKSPASAQSVIPWSRLPNNDRLIHLKVRDFQVANDPEKFDTELDGHYVQKEIEVPISKLALILIDVWAEHPNDGWAERERMNIETKLAPLVNAAREHGMLIVHSPHGRAIHPLVSPLPNEVVVDGPYERDELVQVLRKKGIQYLLYAGYATQMCVLHRPTGIIEMWKHGWANRIILVRDATIAIEAPWSLEGELTHKVVVYMVETNYGMSTTVEEVIRALEEKP